MANETHWHTLAHALRELHRALVERARSDSRLAHHTMIATCDLLGECPAGKQAVALARRYADLEIRYLRSYGWGFGPQVVSYYDRASRRNTVRSEKSKDYKRGTRDLMNDLVNRV